MPFTPGSYGINGPIIDGAFADLTASIALRDFGAVSVRAGRIRKVNDAGDAWVDIPGWVVV